ncbi:MAG: potassium channel family protein, partial [Salinivenus sp.]
MTSFSRRTIYYLLVLVGATALFTGVYALGMSVWEGRPRPWYQALEVIIQTFTTTGYGEDAPWQSPQMNLLMIVTQLAGIGFILSAVDVFVVPWLREALRPTAPSTVSSTSGHIIVCGYTPRIKVFVEALEARGHDYLLVEPDAERAGRLYEEEYPVIEGDPTTAAVLERAHITTARALVADVADDTNASIVLAAREVTSEVRIITLTEDASLARYHRAAGADVALSPRQLLGRSLAAKVPLAAAANVEDNVVASDNLELAELVVTPHGPLHGHTVSDVALADRFGVRVIGAWIEGTFETPAPEEHVLDDTTRLFLAGTPNQLEALRSEMAPFVRAFTPQSILLAGYGDSGHAAAETLRQAEADLTVLDQRDADDVDVVGDVRNPEALQSAGIETASALLIAVDDDTVATFATLIARDLNPDLQILVRAQNEAAVQNLHRAGADFVQALPSVCGRMLAATVLEDEQPHQAHGRAVNVVRWSVAALEGRPLTILTADTQTNYTLLAVVRGDEFLTDPPPDARFGPEDEVIVAGTDEGLE